MGSRRDGKRHLDFVADSQNFSFFAFSFHFLDKRASMLFIKRFEFCSCNFSRSPIFISRVLFVAVRVEVDLVFGFSSIFTVFMRILFFGDWILIASPRLVLAKTLLP